MSEWNDFSAQAVAERFEQRQRENLAKRPSPEENAGREAQRHARRAELKRLIATARLAEGRYAEILRAIDGVNAKKDELASRHVSDCAPLQSQLASIEEKQTDRLLAEEPTDAVLEERRAELLTELRTRNVALEDAISGQDRLIASLNTEAMEVGRRSADKALVSELLANGNPELRMQMRVKQSALNLSVRRAEFARDRWQLSNDPFWAAEIADSEAAVSAATEAVDKVYQAIIEE